LVLGAAGAVLVRDGEDLLDVLRGGQGVFNVVPLSGVLGEVDAAIVELGGGSPEVHGLQTSKRPAHLA
jgi:hypothetical protein